DGNEDRRDGVRTRAELVQRFGFDRKRRRTNIRTIGVAEEDKHIFAAELRVRAARAVLIGERERTAELVRGRDWRPRLASRALRVEVAQAPNGARSRENEKCDNRENGQREAFHLSLPSLSTLISLMNSTHSKP